MTTTPAKVRDELWQLAKSAWRVYGVRPAKRSWFNERMADKLAKLEDADGTIDGRELKAALRDTVKEHIDG